METFDGNPIAPSTVVRVVDPHLPRGYWPVVTVSKILPSSDGKVRVVEIFREGKYSIRPASRLIVLRELTDDADKTMG